MKYALISLALVAGPVLACPADGSKDAMAPTGSTPAVAATKAVPLAKTAAAKPATKVAAKPAAEVRKTASL